MLRIIITAAAFFLVSVPTAHATDATLGRLSWSAFECMVFAEVSGQTAEQGRLATLGVDAGRRFITAMQAGEFSDEAVSENTPIGFLMVLGGPSVDFMLGRVFEAAADSAHDRIREDAGDSLDQALRRIVADNLFSRHNCALPR